MNYGNEDHSKKFSYASVSLSSDEKLAEESKRRYGLKLRAKCDVKTSFAIYKWLLLGLDITFFYF